MKKTVATMLATGIAALAFSTTAAAPAEASNGCPPTMDRHGQFCIAKPMPRCTFWQLVTGRTRYCR